MNKALKRSLSITDLFMIVVNLIPVYGVWYKGWNASEVFLVYCLETIIIGGYNVAKMILTTLVKKNDTWVNAESTSSKSGWFFIMFFIVHYSIFVAVQMSIFFDTADFSFNGAKPSGVIDLVFNFPKYVSPAVHWLMIGFIISYGLLVLKDYVLSGRFRTASMIMVMFEPYPRILVQQFVVIVGSFFLALAAGKAFILVFAIVKIFFTVAIDYEKILQRSFAKVPGSQLPDQ